jgi:predicted MFS family arabinose efflux permease
VTFSSRPDPATIITHKHRGLLPFLGMASGASVATIYYNQPLLLEISRTFHVSSSRAGTVAVATQIGYAAGILVFVPLGDVAERRALIVKLFAAVTVALLAAGLAPSLWTLVAASIAIGMTASVTHILVPIAPELADPEESGRAIGTVMTGLLLGILLGRAASGIVAAMLGWRAVFLIAAAFTALFVPLLWWRLPQLPPLNAVSYTDALRSLWKLVIEQPTLREAATIGFLVFAAFASFWTNLAFLLGTPHYRLGAGVAGAFGVLGAAGAIVASIAGRLADRHGSRWVIAMGLGMLSAGYALLWVAGYHMAGLIAGVIILDIGQQATQIANQTRIFSLVEGARSRINTIYMIVFFLGGAAGSALSTAAWAHWQWNGVCALGLILLALAGVRHSFGAAQQTAKS